MTPLERLAKGRKDPIVRFKRKKREFVVCTRCMGTANCIIECEIIDPGQEPRRVFYAMPLPEADSTTAQHNLMQRLEAKDPAALNLIAAGVS